MGRNILPKANNLPDFYAYDLQIIETCKPNIFYGLFSKLNTFKPNCYLKFQPIGRYLLMVKYFKTLTIKILNMFRNNLNRNVLSYLSGKLFAIKNQT